VEIEMEFKDPNGLELSTLHNLGQMLIEYMPDWSPKYMRCDSPVDLRGFFLNGKMFTRATYQFSKYGNEFFIHVDFKDTVEVYVVEKKVGEVIRRKLYTVDRPDSLKLFRIITDELETATNAYQESEAN
jgi:hypothetical protein